PGLAVAIGGDRLLRSTDDGRTWAAVAPAHGRNRLQVVSPSTVLAFHGTGVTPNPDGRLLRSSDGGATWTDLGTVFPRGTGGFAVTAGQLVFATDTTGDVFRSFDAGATWSRVFDAPFVGFQNGFPLAAPRPDAIYLTYG